MQKESIQFKFKKPQHPLPMTEDYWYMLTNGGWLKPAEVLEDPDQVGKVNAAIALLRAFEEQAEEAQVIEYI